MADQLVLDRHADTRYEALNERFNSTDRLQRDEMGAVKGDVKQLASVVTDLVLSVKDLGKSWDVSRRPNYAIIAFVAATLISVVPGVWVVVNYAITTNVAPIAGRLGQLETGNVERDRRLTESAKLGGDQARELATDTQNGLNAIVEMRRQSEQLALLTGNAAASSVADGVSRTDRAQLNDRVRQNEAAIGTDRAEWQAHVAETNARLLEVEQQFHAISNIGNMQWSEQQRVNAMTFEKLHPGERYPTETFFPSTIFQAPAPMGGK